MTTAALKPTSTTTPVVRILADRRFFIATVVLFILSAGLIALSMKHDLLFDEGYHMAIARIFAENGVPFVAAQTPDQAWLGDLTRFGSYLYHYVVSFPLRPLLGADPSVQFFVVRSIGVLMAAASFVWFRRALLTIGFSGATTHLVLFLVAALPLSTFSAATVNYDNLLILIAALYFALLARMATASATTWEQWFGLAILGGLGALTKFTFLPVIVVSALALLIFRVVRAVRTSQRGAPRWGFERRRALSIALTILVFAVVVLAVAERYLVNLALYGTPAPECDDVQAVTFCQSYGPWRRNAELDAAFPDQPAGLGGLLAYLLHAWRPALLDTLSTVGYSGGFSEGPAVVATLIAVAVTAAAILVVIALPRLLRSAPMTIIALTLVGYLFILVSRNYAEFLRFGAPVAVSGRYLLPFVPFVLAAACWGIATLLPRAGRVRAVVASALAVVAVLLTTQGGFALTLLAVADDSWFDPASPLAALTPLLRAVASVVVIG